MIVKECTFSPLERGKSMFTVYAQEIRDGSWSLVARAESPEGAVKAANAYATTQTNCILKIKDFSGDIYGRLVK